jgi:hypothetical protein
MGGGMRQLIFLLNWYHLAVEKARKRFKFHNDDYQVPEQQISMK